LTEKGNRSRTHGEGEKEGGRRKGKGREEKGKDGVHTRLDIKKKEREKSRGSLMADLRNYPERTSRKVRKRLVS